MEYLSTIIPVIIFICAVSASIFLGVQIKQFRRHTITKRSHTQSSDKRDDLVATPKQLDVILELTNALKLEIEQLRVEVSSNVTKNQKFEKKIQEIDKQIRTLKSEPSTESTPSSENSATVLSAVALGNSQENTFRKGSTIEFFTLKSPQSSKEDDKNSNLKLSDHRNINAYGSSGSSYSISTSDTALRANPNDQDNIPDSDRTAPESQTNSETLH